MAKIFVVGLPRTGTTSVCIALLRSDFKIAHSAYRKEVVDAADVVADTPVFHWFEALDRAYPGSRFVYLERKADDWLPSIELLLQNMWTHLQPTNGLFNELVKTCYFETFAPLNAGTMRDRAHLEACYHRHRDRVLSYFRRRGSDLISIDVSHADSAARLSAFLNLDPGIRRFPLTNRESVHTDWDAIRHPNRVDSGPQSATWES